MCLRVRIIIIIDLVELLALVVLGVRIVLRVRVGRRVMWVLRILVIMWVMMMVSTEIIEKTREWLNEKDEEPNEHVAKHSKQSLERVLVWTKKMMMMMVLFLIFHLHHEAVELVLNFLSYTDFRRLRTIAYERISENIRYTSPSW